MLMTNRLNMLNRGAMVTRSTCSQIMLSSPCLGRSAHMVKTKKEKSESALPRNVTFHFEKRARLCEVGVCMLCGLEARIFDSGTRHRAFSLPLQRVRSAHRTFLPAGACIYLRAYFHCQTKLPTDYLCIRLCIDIIGTISQKASWWETIATGQKR